MVSITGKKLTSFTEKALGLIKYSKAEPVFFTTRFGIHTFGMKFPIDVLVLDNKYHIVKEVSNLKPNSFLFWNPIYSNILELPSGYISKHQIKVGDTLNLLLN